MDFEKKLTEMLKGYKAEAQKEIRDQLMPAIMQVEQGLNSIKSFFDDDATPITMSPYSDKKYNILSSDSKVQSIKKATVNILKTKQLNNAELREHLVSKGIIKNENTKAGMSDHKTARSVISKLYKNRIILKTNKERGAPYYFNPNPPVEPIKKIPFRNKPEEPIIKWETEIPKILEGGPKISKDIISFILKKYNVDPDNKSQRNRIANNFRFAAWHQKEKGVIKKFRKDGKLWFALPEYEETKLHL